MRLSELFILHARLTFEPGDVPLPRAARGGADVVPRRCRYVPDSRADLDLNNRGRAVRLDDEDTGPVRTVLHGNERHCECPELRLDRAVAGNRQAEDRGRYGATAPAPEGFVTAVLTKQHAGGSGRKPLRPALAAVLALTIFLVDTSVPSELWLVLYGIVVLISATFCDWRGVILIAIGCAALVPPLRPCAGQRHGQYGTQTRSSEPWEARAELAHISRVTMLAN